LIPGWKSDVTLGEKQMVCDFEEHDGHGTCFYVAAKFPGRQNRWITRAIAWTMIQPTNGSNGPWESRNHFSMLPYGWIPDDGVDFFKQFVRCLKDMWCEECDSAEKVLAERVSPILTTLNLSALTLLIYVFDWLINKLHNVAQRAASRTGEKP
jgi:hypothetical protein